MQIKVCVACATYELDCGKKSSPSICGWEVQSGSGIVRGISMGGAKGLRRLHGSAVALADVVWGARRR